MAKIIVEIDEKLKREFVVKCAKANKKQKEIIESWIVDWVFSKKK